MNPVHFDENEKGWYFWTESWADREGPFETLEEAYAVFEYYCRTELGE